MARGIVDIESVKSLSSTIGWISIVAHAGDDTVRLPRSHCVIKQRTSRWFSVNSFTWFFGLKSCCIKRPTILFLNSSPHNCVYFILKIVSSETSKVLLSLSCIRAFRSLSPFCDRLVDDP